MQIFEGEKLKRLTDKAGLLPRTRVSEYAAQFMERKNRKVLMIYGPRKTGRTAVLLRALADRAAVYIRAERGEQETAADYARIISCTEHRFIAIDDFDMINGGETLYDVLYDEVRKGKRIAAVSGLRTLFPSAKTDLLCSATLTWKEWEAIGGAGAEEYISELLQAYPDAEEVLAGGGSDKTAAALAKMYIIAPAQEWNGSGRKRYICVPALARHFSAFCTEADLLKTRLASILWQCRYSEDNLYYLAAGGEELFAMTQQNGRYVYLFGAGAESAEALSSETLDEEFPDGEILGRIAVTKGGELYSSGGDDAIKYVPVDMEDKFANYGSL